MFGIKNKTKNNQLSVNQSTVNKLSVNQLSVDTFLNKTKNSLSETKLDSNISDEIYLAKTNTRAKNILRVQAMLKVAMACGFFVGAIGGTSSLTRRSTKLSKRKVIDASKLAYSSKNSIHRELHHSNIDSNIDSNIASNIASLGSIKDENANHNNSSTVSQGVVFNKIHSSKALMNLRKNIDYTNTSTGLYFVSENGDLHALDTLSASSRVESVSPVFAMILQKDGITYVQVYEQLDSKKPIIITTNRAKQRYDVDLTTARLAERSMLYSRNVKDIKQKKLF